MIRIHRRCSKLSFAFVRQVYPLLDREFAAMARDGETIQQTARFLADTVNVGPGQRYDVVWTARAPGKWLIHCHIPHHTTNNNVEEQGGGGLTMVINVAP